MMDDNQPAPETKPNMTKPIIETIDAEKIQTPILIQTEQHNSHWPHPGLMRQYQEIDPNFPKWIMQMTQDQLTHNQKMQIRWASNSFREGIINNVFAFLAIALFCAVGIWFMEKGHPNAGATIITACAVSAAGIFIVRQYQKAKEIAAENKPAPKE